MALSDDQVNGAGVTEFVHLLATAIHELTGSSKASVLRDSNAQLKEFRSVFERRLASACKAHYPVPGTTECMVRMSKELVGHLDNPNVAEQSRLPPDINDLTR